MTFTLKHLVMAALVMTVVEKLFGATGCFLVIGLAALYVRSKL